MEKANWRPQMTFTTSVVLKRLLECDGKATHGYALMQATGLAQKSVYDVLRRLEEHGWLTASWEEAHPGAHGNQRRCYVLTPHGAKAARALLIAKGALDA